MYFVCCICLHSCMGICLVHCKGLGRTDLASCWQVAFRLDLNLLEPWARFWSILFSKLDDAGCYFIWDLRDKIARVSFVKATSDRNLVSSGLPKFIYI